MQKISGAVLRCKILKLGWISSELFAASSKGHGPNMCKLEFFFCPALVIGLSPDQLVADFLNTSKTQAKSRLLQLGH